VRRTASLRRRLLIGVLSAVAVAWIAVAASAYLQARHELDELLDAHLAQSAAILLAQLSEEAEEIELDHAPQLHRYARRVAFQIWERGQRLRLHSVSAPSTRLSSVDEGFSFGDAEGRRWRVFSTWGREREFLIQVAEQVEARDEVSGEIAGHLLAPLGVALPLLGVALALAIRRGLKPLEEVARQLASRDPRRLEPLAAERAPAEIRPLVDRLNGLFERMKEALEHERRFTADASHELRTPIAAIRAQAQVAREATDEAQRRHALHHVVNGCDRATHLIEQLLTLARLDAGTLPYTESRCDLVLIARTVLAELGPWAHGRGVILELVAADPVPVCGNDALLRVLLRNLVDNAVRYSPPDKTVTVRIRMDSAGPRLEVIDQGPGIPIAERERVLSRFYRLAGFEEGSGLGLSIAQRVAELCGAQLALLDAEGHSGVRALVSFRKTSISRPKT
jgi:two-component system sensor histidine kinase QseC